MYNGIDLRLPDKAPRMTHSVIADLITGNSSTVNTDWLDKLGELPWGKIKSGFPEHYSAACNLYSLLHMEYQVCNGGISQYFFNGYHEGNAAHHEDDVTLYDFEAQKSEFENLVSFAREVYPDRAKDHDALTAACAAFSILSYEEDCPVEETVYCDEDQYIFDEELGEEVENPDYFEPYDDVTYENVIHGEAGFDDTFYKASDFMEELFDVRAQFLCKDLARSVEHRGPEAADLKNILQGIMPEAFQKPSLSAILDAAEKRTVSGEALKQETTMEH